MSNVFIVVIQHHPSVASLPRVDLHWDFATATACSEPKIKPGSGTLFAATVDKQIMRAMS